MKKYIEYLYNISRLVQGGGRLGLGFVMFVVPRTQIIELLRLAPTTLLTCAFATSGLHHACYPHCFRYLRCARRHAAACRAHACPP